MATRILKVKAEMPQIVSKATIVQTTLMTFSIYHHLKRPYDIILASIVILGVAALVLLLFALICARQKN
jgi:lipopolysaccharide/colanic/teichoic acid biosynthesis glycosyltransferase